MNPWIRFFHQWGEVLLLCALLLLAAFLRVYQLDSLPPGFQHDEAFNGIDAKGVIAGNRPIFFEGSNGREPLYLYLVALSFWLLGVSPFAMRLVTASLGLASLLATYFLAKELFSRRVAFLTTLLMAISYWHLHESRTGFRAISLPLFEAVALYFLWRGLKKGGLGRFALSGLFFGVAMYTYFSNRLLPMMVVFFLAFLFLWQRRLLREHWRGIALLLLVWGLVFAPLAAYILGHSESFWLRATQVNDLRFILERGDFTPLLTDTRNTLLMFSFRGDDSWKYNLSGRPVFDPITSLFFYLGLALSLLRYREPRYTLILTLFAVMLIPGLITGESPHFLRTIGIMPAVFLFPALGFWEAWDWASPRLKTRERVGLMAVASLFLLALVMATYRDYFVTWARSPEMRAFFKADLTALARYLKQELPKQPREVPSLYISAEYPYDLDRFVLELLMAPLPPRTTSNHKPPETVWFDGRRSFVFPGPYRSTYYFYPATASPPADLFRRFPEVGFVDKITDPQGRTDLQVFYSIGELPPYYLPGGKQLLRRVGQRDESPQFGPWLSLIAYDFPTSVEASKPLTVTLDWQTKTDPLQRPIPEDLSFYAHLIGPWGSKWAQEDFSAFPPADWVLGMDSFINWHTLEVEAGTPPGEYQIEVGVYRRSTLEPMPVFYPGTSEVSDRIVLKGVRVERGQGQPKGLRYQVRANLGDQVELMGYDVDKPIAHTGENLHLTLYWRALKAPLPDYTVFVHLVDETGRIWSQRDSQPFYGEHPTNRWQEGELVKDQYDIPIPPEAPAGRYRLEVGLYSAASGERAKVMNLPQGWRARLERLLRRWEPLDQGERLEADRILLRPNEIRRR